MTDRQLKWFNTRLWPDACRAQRWSPSDRPHKLYVIGEILGREIKTTKDIGWGEEFDKVKNELQLLARPADFNAALSAVTGPQQDQRARWLHKLAAFDALLVAKLTKDFSKGAITDPAELPDNLLKAVVVTCEQIRRGVRYPAKKKAAACGSGLPTAIPDPNFVPFDNQF